MTRGRLVVVPVPWMVSPSVPELRISIAENGHTVVRVDVGSLPAHVDASLETRGVEVTFHHGQWVRTYPAIDDIDPIREHTFDSSSIPYGADDAPDALYRFREAWAQSGVCPDSRFYEVTGSTWIADENAARFGCRHFVIVGHDIWMELLAVDYEWGWTAPGARSIDL